MDKKRPTILLAIFIVSVFFAKAFGQAEKEVMKRYDYSSPRASYESLKKAIMSEDVAGVYIHIWQIGRALSLEEFQINFEDALQNIKNRKAYKNSKEYKYKGPDLIESVKDWYSSCGWVKFAEMEFLKESDKEHSVEGNVGATYCYIYAQRKSDGCQLQLGAINYDGTSEWWIFVYPGGE